MSELWKGKLPFVYWFVRSDLSSVTPVRNISLILWTAILLIRSFVPFFCSNFLATPFLVISFFIAPFSISSGRSQ
jgi:hypothetical protein